MIITPTPLFLLRHAGVVEMSLGSFRTKPPDSHEDFAVYLSHDLSLLRLIETFSESAPQLVLMLTIILQRGQLDPVTGAVPHSWLAVVRRMQSGITDKDKGECRISTFQHF